MKANNKLNRREFARLALIGAGAMALGVPTLGLAAGTELKMAFFPSPRHPLWSKMMVPWADQLEAANLGFKVLKFPGSQIGGKPPGAFKRVVNGISDVELHLPGYTSTVFPRTLVMEVPLQWDSPTNATRAIWNIYDKHLASEYSRVKLLALWATDVPVVMTNKLVRVPDDLRGLKLRTPSKNQAAIIEGLGAIPVAMPITQTYGAIEKGVVDGAIVGISVVNSFKLAEVVKHFIVDLPFGYSPIIIAMNKKRYDGLTAEQRALVDNSSGLDYSLKGAGSYERSREAGIATVNKREGSSVTKLTAAEHAAWVERLEKVVDGWVDTFEKQGLPYRQILDDYLGKG
jgi:TRAP-type C4-dicarboxylate transport system substrate-binding protein